jgi:hypothetical protein
LHRHCPEKRNPSSKLESYNCQLAEGKQHIPPTTETAVMLRERCNRKRVFQPHDANASFIRALRGKQKNRYEVIHARRQWQVRAIPSIQEPKLAGNSREKFFIPLIEKRSIPRGEK